MSIARPVRTVAVSRTDTVYECFPDLARLADGTLLCVYRESDSHVAHDYSHLVWRTSADDGETWSARHLLVESCRGDDLYKWNCPRTGRLSDGRVYYLCDGYPSDRRYEDEGSSTKIWWRTPEGGWDGPHDTGVPGIVPDRLCELPDGTLLLGSHVRDEETGKLKQMVARSDDGRSSWSPQATIAADPGLNLCEGSILPLPGGELVCYMRENSAQGWPLYKSISRDGGASWQGPYLTLIHGGHRPVAGLLPDGEIMITYRYTTGGSPFQAKGLFAWRESVQSALCNDPSDQYGRVLAIDHDRSPRPDTAYSGWVNLPDGRTFIVNYIVDDAPMAQIRGYWIKRNDFLLTT